MKKFNWQNIRLVLMLIVVIFLYSFTQNRSQNKKISKIQVEFQGNNKMFLTNEMVNNLLIQNLGGTSSIQKDKVDLKDLETALKKHSFIENAEVYISEDGMLITKVLQKSPVARVVNNNRVLYVDKNGSIFQLSNNFSSRVPIVQGNIEGEFKTAAMLMEKAGTGGALFRNLYRDFLKESYELVKIEQIKIGYEAFAEIAELWTAISQLFEKVSQTKDFGYIQQASEILKKISDKEKKTMQTLATI